MMPPSQTLRFASGSREHPSYLVYVDLWDALFQYLYRKESWVFIYEEGYYKDGGSEERGGECREGIKGAVSGAVKPGLR